MSKSILTVGPTGSAHRYSSFCAASRALSGNGSTSVRMTISRRVQSGGGYIGDVWVEGSNIPVVSRT